MDRVTEMPDPSPDDSNGPERGIMRRQISPNPETVEYDFMALIAEVEGVEIDDLPSLWDEVDGLVKQIFETPPAQEAQVELSFSYGGHRVTIDRKGTVTVVQVKESTGP